LSDPKNMSDIARTIKAFDTELRQELLGSRSGVFKNEQGELYVRSNVPFGQGYQEEVLGIFADISDLDFFYKIYLKDDD